MTKAGPTRGRSRGAGRLRATFLAAALALLPIAAITTDAPAAGVVTATDAGMRMAADVTVEVHIPVPALTPGLPPPQLSALSDRRLVAGVILVLFSGFAALTYTMWRELGRRVS